MKQAVISKYFSVGGSKKASNSRKSPSNSRIKRKPVTNVPLPRKLAVASSIIDLIDVEEQDSKRPCSESVTRQKNPSVLAAPFTSQVFSRSATKEFGEPCRTPSSKNFPRKIEHTKSDRHKINDNTTKTCEYLQASVSDASSTNNADGAVDADGKQQRGTGERAFNDSGHEVPLDLNLFTCVRGHQKQNTSQSQTANQDSVLDTNLNYSNKLKHHRLHQLVYERQHGIQNFGQGQVTATTHNQKKLTALEEQVHALKKKHPDLFLFVEVGYRYRFFGDDAKVASQLLNIVAHKQRHFMVASIPTHRLSVHIQRVVAAGYKVGVVRQTETAALKKEAKCKSKNQRGRRSGGNESKCFMRSVTAIYTKGTLLPGEQFGSDPDLGDTRDSNTGIDTDMQQVVGGYINSGSFNGSQATSSNVIMSVCEVDMLEEDAGASMDPSSSKSNTTSSQDRVTLGICAVDLNTGTVIYDEFDDDFLRGNLITRLAHIRPVEVLLPRSQSKGSEILGDDTSSSALHDGLSLATQTTFSMLERRGILEGVRFERVINPPHLRKSAKKLVEAAVKGENSTFAESENYDLQTPGDTKILAKHSTIEQVVAVANELPLQALRAFASLMTYLSTFGLQKSFLSRIMAHSKESLTTKTPKVLSSFANDFKTSAHHCKTFMVPFSSIAQMHLDGHTLVNLDMISSSIYKPSFDFRKRHSNNQFPTSSKSLNEKPAAQTPNESKHDTKSLLQLLNHTCTRGGRSQLQKWILRPLTTQCDIEQRLDAVEEMAFGIITDGPSELSSQRKCQTNSQTAASSLSESTPDAQPVGCPSCLLPLIDKIRGRKCQSLGLFLTRLEQGRLTPLQFCEMIENFRQVLAALPAPNVAAAEIKSTALRRLFVGNTLSGLSSVLVHQIAQIHPNIVNQCLQKLVQNGNYDGKASPAANTTEAIGAVKSSKSPRLMLTDIHNVFASVEAFPELNKLHCEVIEVATMLKEHLLEVRDFLGIPTLEYKTLNTGYNSQLEFMVELKSTTHRALIHRIPTTWSRVSATKQVERFHTPTVIRAIEKLELAREKIQIHTRLAWIQHQQIFCAAYRDQLSHVVSLISQVDALQALAQIARLPNYCRPRFLQNEGKSSYLHIVNGRHPIVEVFNTASTAPFVPNTVTLGSLDMHVSMNSNGNDIPNASKMSDSQPSGSNCILLTGPNMGGKSCLVRMIGLAVVMAQSGCFVAADSMTTTVFDGVFTRMGSSDSILSGMSTFLVEMSQTAHILAQATSRSLVILDELGRGTSNLDGEAIAHATLRHCVEEIGCLTIFITHYPNLSACASYSKPLQRQLVSSTQPPTTANEWTSSDVRNMHMAYLQASADEDDVLETSDDGSQNINSQIEELIRPVTFLYRLVDGPSPKSYGINVARMAGISRSVLKEAARMSAQITSDTLSKNDANASE